MLKMDVSNFGMVAKLNIKPYSCKILHNRMLPRVLANKIIFTKNKLIISLICLFLKCNFVVLLLWKTNFCSSIVELSMLGTAKKNLFFNFECYDLKIGEIFCAKIWCTCTSTS